MDSLDLSRIDLHHDDDEDIARPNADNSDLLMIPAEESAIYQSASSSRTNNSTNAQLHTSCDPITEQEVTRFLDNSSFQETADHTSSDHIADQEITRFLDNSSFQEMSGREATMLHENESLSDNFSNHKSEDNVNGNVCNNNDDAGSQGGHGHSKEKEKSYIIADPDPNATLMLDNEMSHADLNLEDPSMQFNNRYSEIEPIILEQIGCQFIDTLRLFKSESARVHLMAVVCGGPRISINKRELSKILGRKIHDREIKNARQHRIYPGPGKFAPKKSFFRRRSSEKSIADFIEWLYAGDYIQGLSYGQKIVQYSSGVHLAIESVKRTCCIHQIVREYAETWVEEGLVRSGKISYKDATYNGVQKQPFIAVEKDSVECSLVCDEKNEDDKFSDDPSDSADDMDDEEDYVQNVEDIAEVEALGRCTKQCRKTRTFCLRSENHDGQCIFTPKGKLSPSTVSKLLKGITSGDLKSLRGLDNIYVEKGEDNFEKMKAIVRSLVAAGKWSSLETCPEALHIIAEIDKSAKFHKVEFARHLGQGE